MKSIAAGKFKDRCLKTLDEVAAAKSAIVITKRGRPVAKLVPYVDPAKKNSLAGSVLKEVGDPFGTGARWDADDCKRRAKVVVSRVAFKRDLGGCGVLVSPRLRPACGSTPLDRALTP